MRWTSISSSKSFLEYSLLESLLISLGRPEASIFNGVGHLVLLVLPTFLRKTNRTKSSFQKKASIKKEKKSDFFSFFLFWNIIEG